MITNLRRHLERSHSDLKSQRKLIINAETTGTALPANNDASSAYHNKWRNVDFQLSQTQ